MPAEELPLQPAQSSPHEKSIDEFASHIAAHAPVDPYIEQKIREYRSVGLDPKEIPTHPMHGVDTTKPTYSGDAYEGDLHPPYHNKVDELTPEEIRVGKLGAQAAQIALRGTKKE